MSLLKKFTAVTAFVLFCIGFPCAPAAHAEQKVERRHMYERVVCVVPLVGKGTVDDPKRPLYAPAPKDLDSRGRRGIIGFQFLTTDDGKSAVVEFVGLNRTALQQVLDDKNVKAFLKGKNSKDDIEGEVRKYKKDFKLEQLGVGVQ